MFFKTAPVSSHPPRPLLPDTRSPCPASHGLSAPSADAGGGGARCLKGRGGGQEGRKGGGEGKGREGEGVKKENGGGWGASGCSCSCGPGGELPSPGCSAETSMGGCVGSHHDSSGSLNENSDGTGGNSAFCRVFFPALFCNGGCLQVPCVLSCLEVPPPALPCTAEPDRARLGSLPPRECRSDKRVDGQQKPARGDFMKRGLFPERRRLFVLCCCSKLTG